MSKFVTCLTPGCFLFSVPTYPDDRGSFTKLINRADLLDAGVRTNFAESFISESKKGVIRGFHFQVPPKDQAKMVFCLNGNIADVLLDLRKQSPQSLKHEVLHLQSEEPQILYIPPGVAHAFQSLTEVATLIYWTSGPYSAEYDKGILWNSVGVRWPLQPSNVSKRDQGFPKIEGFQSPFE